MVEHGLEAAQGDVALGLAVDGVAHLHVVGRHGLGDRSRGAAGPEEPAGDLLTSTDLGDGPVPAGVEVDLQGLLKGVCTELQGVHAAIISYAPRFGHELREMCATATSDRHVSAAGGRLCHL